MLRWALMFFGISVVEGVVGYMNTRMESVILSGTSLTLAITFFVLFHRH